MAKIGAGKVKKQGGVEVVGTECKARFQSISGNL